MKMRSNAGGALKGQARAAAVKDMNAAAKKPAGMAMGGVSAAAKAGGKAYGQGVAASKKPAGMAKGGVAKKGKK